MKNLCIGAGLILVLAAAACGGGDDTTQGEGSSPEVSVQRGAGLAAIPALDAAQAASGALPGITVIGSAQAKTEPDGAIVRLTVGADEFGAIGPGGVSMEIVEEDDLNPVAEALQEEGVAEDDIFVDTFVSGSYGPYGIGAAQITFHWSSPRDLKSVLDVAQAAVRRETDYQIQSLETLFTIEDCQSLEEQARSAALDDVRERAQDLAELADLTLAGITAISEVPSFTFAGGVPGGCAALQQLPPFESFSSSEGNSPSEVTVTVNLQVTFAVQ
jgi:uncharacterized protein YggE